MALVILGIYAIFVLLYVVTFFFIIFHLTKYSINLSVKIVILPIFIVISILLLLSNITLFSTVDWNGLLLSLPFN